MTRQIPMLFSPAMINALLANRKTETRRTINPQPKTFENSDGETCDVYPFCVDGQTRSRIAMGFDRSGVITEQKCSAEVGDLIWVKEAHYAFGWWETTDELTKKTRKPKRQFVRYPAKPVLFETPADVMTGRPEQQSGWYKRSSIFLPKLESRLTLRVTGFTIEQLHQITNTGAVDEGCDVKATDPILGTPLTFGGFNEYVTALEWYRRLWNKINGSDAWDANPWVDVTKFEVLRQNVAEVTS